MGFVEVLKQPNNPEVSIFVPFTRLWAVDDFLDRLMRLELHPYKTELVFYNDTNDKNLQATLMDFLNRVKDVFNGATLYCSQKEGPTESDAIARRARITQVKEKSKDFIANSKYVFGIEDDTFLTKEYDYLRLYNAIESKNAGFVSGVERGRWGFSIIGGWRTDDIHNPTMMTTIPYMPPSTRLEAIDGGGFYCYITLTELYKSITYRFDEECFGPDVCYVLDVRRAGYDAFIDWSVVCEHHTQNMVLLPKPDCMVVQWRKVNDKWLIVET